MPTVLSLWKNLLRKLRPDEVDTNFINVGATADAAATAASSAVTTANAAAAAVATKSPLAGPGTGQAFSVGALATSATTYDYTNPFLSTAYMGNPFFRMYMDAAWVTYFEAIPVASKLPQLAFKVAGVEAGRFDYSGNLLVGGASGANHVLAKNVGASGAVLDIKDGTNIIMEICGGSEYSAATNGALTVMYLGKNTSSSRSANVQGTLNVSGADYAEYERKSETCGVVVKGQIIGFDSNGKVTDKWSEAISFGVKSTNPNLVGGDTWGSEDAVGKRPKEPVRIPDTTEQREVVPAVLNAEGKEIAPAEFETITITPGDNDVDWAAKEAIYATDLAAFEAKLEEERQTVDRIAYSGKVPCNVVGALVGDYIVAVQNGEGIKGDAVTAPTFEQYQKAVGRVRCILADGRPEIAVMVH